jgi:hypothetical protein
MPAGGPPVRSIAPIRSWCRGALTKASCTPAIWSMPRATFRKSVRLRRRVVVGRRRRHRHRAVPALLRPRRREPVPERRLRRPLQAARARRLRRREPGPTSRRHHRRRQRVDQRLRRLVVDEMSGGGSGRLPHIVPDGRATFVCSNRTEPVGSARFAQIMTIASANPSDRFSATHEVDRRCPEAH